MTDLMTAADIVTLDGAEPGDRELLGGKACSVNAMRALGLRVPPAFAVTTRVCQEYHAAGGRLPDRVWPQVVAGIRDLERATGRTFGAGPEPLLVSVRSGAAQSMPGMMDTVLNLGLTRDLADALATSTGDTEWADDTWRRFCASFGEIVLDDPEALPPEDPWEQLRAAIGAVFDSWTNDRVRAYRQRHGLGEGGGTAVTVQAMVFGNRDDDSATGVLFSRDPGTGAPTLYGEWLPRAQGEDVVSGAATPQPLATLATRSPELHDELAEVAALLEREHRDLVDIEFTIESGRLYVLQSRAGKRSAVAAARIAVDLAEEGLITRAEAVARVGADQRAAAAAQGSVGAGTEVLATGLSAGPGVAVGVAVSDESQALELSAAGTPFVLVRPATVPEDVPLMFEAVAVVTELGGSTSHAALVCREIGLPCVVGAGEGVVDALTATPGTLVTVDGAAGTVHRGDVTGTGAPDGATGPATGNPHVATLERWAEEL